MGGTRTLIAIAPAAIYCLTGALFASNADAMTLAPIAVRSYLGQNLVAEIDILNITAQEEESLQAGIASAKVFADLAMGYSQSIGQAQIALLRRPTGTRFIQLRSTRPIGEPYVDLVIEVSSSAAKFVRPYRLLVDPAPLNDEMVSDAQLAGREADPSTSAHLVKSPLEMNPVAASVTGPSAGTSDTAAAKRYLESPTNPTRNKQSALSSNQSRIASTYFRQSAMLAERDRATAVETPPAAQYLTNPRNTEMPASGALAAMVAPAPQTAAPQPLPGAASSLVLARTEPGFLSMALESLTGVLNVFIVGLCAIVAAVGYLVWAGERKKFGQKKRPSIATDTAQTPWTNAKERDNTRLGGEPADAMMSKPWTQADNMVVADAWDPMAAADVYFAYGKDEAAEEHVRESLMQDPQGLAIHRKLAEIHAARQDATTFAKCADQIQALGGKDSADWTHIQSLAQSMEAVKPSHQNTVACAPEAHPKCEILEFDHAILPSKADTAAPSNSPPAKPTSVASGWDPVLSFAPAEGGAAAGATAQSVSTPSFDLDALSLALAANPSLQKQSISEQLETSMELAKPFIDHGDLPSTRSMLEEVMANGSDEQPPRVLAAMANPK